MDKFEEESWSLDINLAKHILPRLLYLKNWTYLYSHPSELEDSYEWNEILEELVWTFTYISNEYPSIASNYIDDVEFISEEKEKDDNFITGNIKITYTDESLYNKGRIQDQINLARCQKGLRLFSEYYMSLWN